MAEIKMFFDLLRFIFFFCDLSQISGVISETPISTAFSRNISNLVWDFNSDIPTCRKGGASNLVFEIISSLILFLKYL